MGLAIINVGRHYNLAVAEKTMDWMNLIMCLGVVYGSRFVMITQRVNNQKQAQRTAQVAARAEAVAKQNDVTVDLSAVPNSPMNGATVAPMFGTGGGVNDMVH